MFHDVNPAILPRIARTTDTKVLFVVLDAIVFVALIRHRDWFERRVAGRVRPR